MANRRQFLEDALIGCGIVAFTGRTKAFYNYVTALFSSKPKLLPEGWEFYEVGGQVLFPVYGRSGGLSTHTIFYLVQKSQGKNYCIALSADELMTENHKDIERLVAFKLKDAIRNIRPVEVDMNGGELPLPKEWQANA